MTFKIITGGHAYTDIDVLACACAYRQCLSLQGEKANVVLRAPFNETISDSIKKWGYNIDFEPPQPLPRCQYVLVDVSDPQYFETFVPLENVVEVVDHHFGFEEYWKQRLGVKGAVEHVGSCATLIWERFKQAGFDNNIGALEANLLFTAIFANTLNLKAQVTTERDAKAFEELTQFTRLPDQWISQYYNEVSRSIFADPMKAIGKDTKKLTLLGHDVSIAQLELWSADEILKRDDLLQKVKGRYLLIVSEISSQKTYFICEDEIMQEWISSTTKTSFNNHVARADRLWMRKEVIRDICRIV